MSGCLFLVQCNAAPCSVVIGALRTVGLPFKSAPIRVAVDTFVHQYNPIRIQPNPIPPIPSHPIPSIHENTRTPPVLVHGCSLGVPLWAWLVKPMASWRGCLKEHRAAAGGPGDRVALVRPRLHGHARQSGAHGKGAPKPPGTRRRLLFVCLLYVYIFF